MNLEHMIGQMVLGSLGGRRKRSRRAARFLAGGGNSFLNASTLLTLGGLAWGVFETMGRQNEGQGAGQPAGAFPPPPSTHVPGVGPTAPVTPPPLPGSLAPAAVPADIPEGAARIVRLMIAAAGADGSLTGGEREAIVTQARAVGLEAFARRELDRPTPLDAVVAGVADPAQRHDLYTLAFGIVRADEQVSGAERIFLARLATLLGLDPAGAARLEQETATRIDAEDDAG
ncbi:MAG TPA: DUF533 domain-containing protein [Vicinamibacterales bacterium]|nr:DUF533 domain-containing protein [Vicinamibacterales bacterium]